MDIFTRDRLRKEKAVEEASSPSPPPAPVPSASSPVSFEKKFTPEEKKKQAAKLAELLRKRD